MLGLPLAGSYHTELAAYAELRSGDPRVVARDAARARRPSTASAAWSSRRRPRRTRRSRALGIAADRIGRWDRGVDVARFSPARRSPAARRRAASTCSTPAASPPRRASTCSPTRSSRRGRAIRGCISSLAGDGPEEERLRARLGRAATFLGWLDGTALATAYASADLFLFAQQTDTFGQVVLEAQASGLPVVAVAAGGPAELVEDGRSGRSARRAPGAGRRGLRAGGLAGDAGAARPRRPGRRARAHLGARARPARRGLAPRAGIRLHDRGAEVA